LDVWYHEVMSKASSVCDVEWLDAEDPLFMLYTSGSTGTPKGVLHSQAGYMLYTYSTFRYVFDYQDDDVFFCTADIGWITGHSYVTYGPLLNGATGVVFEGLPFYPDAGRFWDIVDKYSVTKFYTAPTAIRALMKQGDNYVKKYSRKSLKILGTVGEPINPEAWLWYHRVVGDEKCPIVDTYWQTETGGHVLTPLPACTTTKPGSAAFPFFGVEPALVNDDGCEIEGPGNGFLVFKRPWPGIMRTVFGNHQRFEDTYFKRFPGYYCTGDGCRRDEDGYYWITGRVDDMMNVSGHLLSTAEIESALVSHKAVAEAAVVAAPHEIKGQIPYCFVTLKNGYEFTQDLVEELKQTVRKKIGPVAVPDIMQNAPGLPKTRSGKIMRRILRKVVDGQCEDLGDLTTLADETVIEQLVGNRKTQNQNGLV
jgi:acetyl-CoA synthetase